MLCANSTQGSILKTCSTVTEKKARKVRRHDELQYLELIQYILDNGTKKSDRTGKKVYLVIFTDLVRMNVIYTE